MLAASASASSGELPLLNRVSIGTAKSKSLFDPVARKRGEVMSWSARMRWGGIAAVLMAGPASAQQPAVTWEQLPKMQLEYQFAGPLKDTAIQRWRDPKDNVVCYVYLPFTAQHTPPTAAGYVEYGANIIGTISCLQMAKTASPTAAAPLAPQPSAAKRTAPVEHAPTQAPTSR
jgi:hypothetical protein